MLGCALLAAAPSALIAQTAPARLPRDTFATISQPIELGGKRSARVASATAERTIAGANVSIGEYAVAAEVAQAYVDAVRARALVAAIEEQRDGLSSIVTILDQRLREGMAPEADLRKFEAERTRLGSQLARMSVNLQSALIHLSSLIGQPIAAAQLDAPAITSVPPAMPSPAEAALALRPDVQAADARLRRAEATLAVERARSVPDITVTGGYKRTSGFDSGVAAITMPITLLDRNRVAVAVASGDAAAARSELALVRERALAEIEARWSAATRLAAQAMRSDGELVAPAAIVRSAARAAFAEGRGDLLQLVDAERVYGEARREAAELSLDALLALIHARLASGEPLLP